MLNLIELESRWLRYKIKSFLPHFIIIISLIIIIIVMSIFDFSNPKQTIEKKTTRNITAPKIPIEDNNTNKNSQINEKIVTTTYPEEVKKINQVTTVLRSDPIKIKKLKQKKNYQ